MASQMMASEGGRVVEETPPLLRVCEGKVAVT